jgi:hypothetical protein
MRTPTRFSAPPSRPGTTLEQRFEDFARRIVSVPKAEVDKQKAKAEAKKKGKSS